MIVINLVFSHNINFISNKCTLFIGLNNMFDSDTTNTPNSLSISDASNTLDDVTNSAVYNSNEYDTDTDECIMYEVLDEDYSKETTKTHMSHDVDVVSILMNKTIYILYNYLNYKPNCNKVYKFYNFALFTEF